MQRALLNDNILRSAMASKIAYANTSKKAVSWPICKQYIGELCTERDTNVISVKATGAHAYAWKTGDNAMTIAFKGSSTAKDILNFLDMRQYNFHFCDSEIKVHNGVMRMFRSIEGDLSEFVLGYPINTRNKYITFCGHSLGGSLAMLAAAYYGHLTNNNIYIACHTFGSFKIGDDNFKEWYINGVNESIFVNTTNDVVPMLPLGCVYDDLNQLSFTINKNGKETRDIIGFDQLNPFQAHDLDTYISCIKMYSSNLRSPIHKI